MRKLIPGLFLVSLMVPAVAFAYGKKPLGVMQPMSCSATTGMYIDRQVWLPGSWTVVTGVDKVTFTKGTGNQQVTVRIDTMPRIDCAYGLVRMAALKAWGGNALDQSQGRIQPVTFGTSKFKGYTWMTPSTWAGDQHWCVGQDLKSAFHLTATAGDEELIKFVKNDLLQQLIVRSGRSVLPWPSASGSSSSSSMK
jgi:hypothetical protein